MKNQNKRWELRVFDWILHNRFGNNAFSQTQNKNIYVGLKTIFTEPLNGIIKIKPDSNALFRFAILGLAIATIIFFSLLNANHLTSSNNIIALAISAPFLGFGIHYYIQSRKKISWFIDLSKRIIILSHNGVTFDQISHLSYSRLVNVEDAVLDCTKHYSYHLNLELKNNNQITLFTDANKSAIIDAGTFISSITGIEIKNTIYDA